MYNFLKPHLFFFHFFKVQVYFNTLSIKKIQQKLNKLVLNEYNVNIKTFNF